MNKSVGNSRFKKLFLSYFYVIFISLVLISIIYIQYSTSRMEKEYMNNSMAEMRNMSTGMETLFKSIHDASIQLSLMPTLNKILADPFSTGPYEYGVLRDELKNYVYSNPLIYSLYAYIKLNDKVLTTGEGYYKLSEFFDKEMLQEVMVNEGSFGLSAVKKIPEIYYEDNQYVDVLTLSCPIPLTRSTPLGSLIVNMKVDAIYNVMDKLNGYGFSDVFVVDRNGRIMIHKDKKYLGRLLDEVYFPFEHLNKKEGVQTVTFNKAKYYASYLYSPVNQCTYVSMISAGELSKKVNQENIRIIFIFTPVLLLSLLLAYYFSVKMHDAWKQLIAKLGGYLQNITRDDGLNDEYNAVSHAIDRIIKDNRDINAIVEQNKPIIKDRLIVDLLWNNVSGEEIKDNLKFAGVSFPYKCFLCMVASVTKNGMFDDVKSKGNTRIYVLSMIEQSFSEDYPITGIFFDDDKFAFILNLESKEWSYELKNYIKEKCMFINDKLKEQINLALCFSFGPIQEDISTVYGSFVQARKMLNYRAVIGEEEVLFSIEYENNLVYPAFLQKQIINGLKSGSEEIVRAAVKNLFAEYINKKEYSYEKLQHMIIVLIGAVISELWMEGINSEQQVGMEIFNLVSECKNSSMLEKAMLDYFLSVMIRQRDENRYVEKITKFMQLNYNKDLSVNDIAAHVNLHPTYLGKIFKEYSGKTLMEYLAFWRIQKAKEIFEVEKYSLNEISLNVGFNDVHSFIRYFKKYEGVTPGEYRSALISK